MLLCPNAGKPLAISGSGVHTGWMASVLEQAARRLQLVLGMSSHDAERALAEVLDCFDSAVDEHIRRRHGELQRAGHNNDSIYSIIAEELGTLRFKAPALTSRQIRRRIYG